MRNKISYQWGKVLSKFGKQRVLHVHLNQLRTIVAGCLVDCSLLDTECNAYSSGLGFDFTKTFTTVLEIHVN